VAATDDAAASKARTSLGALGPPIEPVRPVQLYELVRDRLIEQIRGGHWRPGDRLPPERDLARAFEVSRPSLREALGALELGGVVETHRGSGSYVTADAVTRAIGMSASDRKGNGDISPTALLEVRLAVEPAIASSAALRGGPDVTAQRLLSVMQGAVDSSDEGARARWSEADRLFHRELAVMTANPLLIQIAQLICAVMDEPLWRQLRDESLTIPGRLESGVAEHHQIYKAVSEGDVEAGAFHARRHLQIVRRTMELES
jgi:DNA-binding FadR family transcriptional regulator